MSSRAVGIVSGVMLAALLLACSAPSGTSSKPSGGARRANSAASAAKPDEAEEGEVSYKGLCLVKDSLEGTRGPLGTATITGAVVNRTGKRLAYAQVAVTLYDGSGSVVGTAIGNVNNLDPGARWSFTASGIAKGWRTFKVSEVSGF
jgi:hypothetical protein